MAGRRISPDGLGVDGLRLAPKSSRRLFFGGGHTWYTAASTAAGADDRQVSPNSATPVPWYLGVDNHLFPARSWMDVDCSVFTVLACAISVMMRGMGNTTLSNSCAIGSC